MSSSYGKRVTRYGLGVRREEHIIQESVTRPIVHLIGGPPGAGKTTLGIALASRLGCSSLTIDDLRTAILGIAGPEFLPELRVIGMPDAATYFTQTQPDTMIAHALAQHSALWPAVERVVKKRIRNGLQAVLDGWHLMPGLVARANLERTCAVWIDVDEEVLRDRERSVWEFYATSRDPEQMFERFLARSLMWNDRMRSAATEFGFHLVRQDGSRSVSDLVDEVLGLPSGAGSCDL